MLLANKKTLRKEVKKKNRHVHTAICSSIDMCLLMEGLCSPLTSQLYPFQAPKAP